MTTILITAAIFAIAIWLAYELTIKRERATVQTALPPELANAHVWAKERSFDCDSPVRLTGRIDEAFLMPDGTIVVADGKSRKKPRVYDSDILQLSAYRMLIQMRTKKTVRTSGYVRLFTPSGNEYRRVELLDDEEVIAATLLHNDLKDGRYAGTKCMRKEICASCAYKVPCDQMN